jgi:very-short-patch-repair endonuclease
MAEPLLYRHGSVGRARAFRKTMTDGEQKLWSRLRGKQLEYYFRRQTPIGKYIVDFVCWKEKMVVEIDGSQHFTNAGKEHDKIRDQFIQQQGFRILRFNSVEVLDNTDGIIEAIYENLKNPLLSPYKGDSFQEAPNRCHR